MIKLKDILFEGKETLIATGKDKLGKKIEMFKTIRWGGLVTYILKKNGKEYDQYPPNLKSNIAVQKFKKYNTIRRLSSFSKSEWKKIEVATG